MFNLIFENLIIPGHQLPISALPRPDLKVAEASIDLERESLFGELLERVGREGDPILEAIAGGLSINKKIDIRIVFTSGVPAPYDAWTADMNGKPSLFLNLGQWAPSDIQKHGLSVLKHEVTHLLLTTVLQKVDPNDYLARLNRIVLDEGIAHFVGYSSSSNFHWQNDQKWTFAEQKLKEAYIALSSGELSPIQKEAILAESDTGPFWDKYGAIAGMFRAAKLFESEGAGALVGAIMEGRIDLPE